MFWILRYVFAFCLCASAVWAQVSAVLSGTVNDQSGAALSAAKVTAKNVDTGAVRSTVTDAGGHYLFSSLPVGEYEIQADKAQFTNVGRKGDHLVVVPRATVD